MKWISNYVFFAGRRLKNHLVEVNNDSRLVKVTALLDELANTEYVDNALCIVTLRRKRRLEALFARVASVDDFELQFARDFADDDSRKGRVVVAALDFLNKRLVFLQ